MRLTIVFCVALLLSACVVHRLEVTPVETDAGEPVAVTTPVKAHLNDGSTVVFAEGVTVSGELIRGDGVIYDLTLEESRSVSEISLADVAAMESYQTPTSTSATTTASIASTIAITAVVGLATVALFGSCPTVYGLDAGDAVLEAELFSYSIAPTFESRDIDRLGARPDSNGLLSLELRNEMLETHYIDHIELLEVTHLPSERAYPDEKGRPLIVDGMIAPSAALDNESRDVLASVNMADGVAWEASKERLATVTENDRIDYIDVEFDVPPGSGDPALVLKMRNSLLNTVLLYDVMLADQGFGALDWLGKDVNRIDNRIRTGLWYRNNMGLEVSVWQNGRLRKVARIGDQGPIAWAERAVRLPASTDGRMKVRLSFTTDNWRIDQVALALDARQARAKSVPVERAENPQGERADIPAFLARADDEYLVTRPQDSVRLEFNVGQRPEGEGQSYFLASEGYYMEWMRSEWLTGDQQRKFVPGDASLMRAIRAYSAKRDGLREQFDSTRIAIR